MRKKVAVIGGGASGMTAAISAAREGAEVTIFERNDRLGKKILATGNGKCNLSNESLSVSDYQTDDRELLKECLERFGPEEAKKFFEDMGLMIRSKNGYLYPYSEQASAVLDVLRLETERLKISVVYQKKIERITKSGSGYRVTGNGISEERGEIFDSVILACGSKASPKSGSDGSGYGMAKSLGCQLIKVVPALTALHCKEEFCKAISGVRAEACVHIICEHREIVKEQGELQLTDYGISGIPVFQLSARVNRMLEEKKEVSALIDFLPNISDAEWDAYCERRMKEIAYKKEETAENFFTGLLHKKLMLLFIKLAGLKTNTKLGEAKKEQIRKVFSLCREFTVHISGSNTYDNAQVCSGGVSMKEIGENMEVKKSKGLYLAGELLNVDGRCGGYNLHWAWCSGYLAGKAAAGRKNRK